MIVMILQAEGKINGLPPRALQRMTSGDAPSARTSKQNSSPHATQPATRMASPRSAIPPNPTTAMHFLIPNESLTR